MAEILKLVRDGKEQTLRLPEAYRFEDDEVTIRREGDVVLLEPVRNTKLKAWLEHIRENGGFDDDMIEAALDRPKDFGAGRRDEDIELPE